MVVLFVLRNKRGELLNRMKEEETKLVDITGNRLKLVVSSGTQLSRILCQRILGLGRIVADLIVWSVVRVRLGAEIAGDITSSTSLLASPVLRQKGGPDSQGTSQILYWEVCYVWI